MATSLIGGLIANNYVATSITVCDRNQDKLARLSQDFAIATTSDSTAACASADVIVLAVKPQALQVVCEQLAKTDIKPGCLFVSVAAGVLEQDINRWLGGNRCIVRCMPNTPSLIQLGATGLFANTQVSQAQKDITQTILDAVGISVWVADEAELNAVTAISGSGPAYFFYFIELLQTAGEKLGLSAETAQILAQQTALGAASMAHSKDVAELRAQVTSKKGTTEQAILSFQKNDLASLVDSATQAAYDRSVALAKELSNQ
ncbi:MAG: pyrroline-5-carboxylate reductase [Gammaproteobacteria bacterium]|jgi:pyrroline-5-carboxylate reductase